MLDKATGPKALADWLDTSGRKISVLAAECGVTAAAVHGWRRGLYGPELPAAITLEKLTGGAVKIEDWGYARDLIDTMRSLVERRDATGTEG